MWENHVSCVCRATHTHTHRLVALAKLSVLPPAPWVLCFLPGRLMMKLLGGGGDLCRPGWWCVGWMSCLALHAREQAETTLPNDPTDSRRRGGAKINKAGPLTSCHRGTVARCMMHEVQTAQIPCAFRGRACDGIAARPHMPSDSDCMEWVINSSAGEAPERQRLGWGGVMDGWMVVSLNSSQAPSVRCR